MPFSLDHASYIRIFSILKKKNFYILRKNISLKKDTKMSKLEGYVIPKGR